MIQSNEGSLVILPPAASLTNATQRMSFDRDGFDQANVYVISGTQATQTAVITGITVGDHDTDTSASNMTAIGALTCSNTTSTAAINAIPAVAYQKLGGIVTEFQIDLRKRKRYIGISVHADTVVTAVISAVARLTRAAENLGTNLTTIAAYKSLPLNKAATAVIGCMQVVAG